MEIPDEEIFPTAIEALGPLFNLSEVYLWDNGSKEIHRVSSFPKHTRFKYKDDDDCCNGGTKNNFDGEVLDDGVLPEVDMDLAQQMSSLGLPVSFQTSKDKSSGTKNGKRGGSSIMNSCSQESGQDKLLHITKLSERENSSDKKFSSSERITPSEMMTELPSSNGTSAQDFASYKTSDHKQSSGVTESSDGFVYNEEGSCYTCSFGYWRAIWDSYYTRNYFYNVETHETTWHPPPGMEHLVLSNNSVDSNADVVRENPVPAVSCNESELTCKSSEGKCGTDGKMLEPILDLNDSMIERLPETVNEVTFDILVAQVGEAGRPAIAVGEIEYEGECGSGRKGLDQLDSNITVNENKSEVCVGDRCRLIDLHSSLDIPEPSLDLNGICDSEITCSVYADGTATHPSTDGRLIETVNEVKVACDILVAQVDEEGMLTIAAGEIDYEAIPAATKRKKKARKPRSKTKSHNSDQEQLFQWSFDAYSIAINKYWCQRYLLFSKFDQGIKMDEEGWFSVTPESIARHQASQCGSGVVIDCFTGVGGNAIQFAKTGGHVVAVDIDPKKIEYAKSNAAVYGVEDQIDFVIGDSFSLASMIKADTVFMSPPWGGPEYSKVKTYDLAMLKPHDGQFLFDTFKETASTIVMFLPRNVDLNQLAELCLSAGPLWSVEVEKNFLNNKLKAITAYFRKAYSSIDA